MVDPNKIVILQSEDQYQLRSELEGFSLWSYESYESSITTTFTREELIQLRNQINELLQMR